MGKIKIEDLENLKEGLYQVRMWSATVIDQIDKQLKKEKMEDS